MPIRVKLIRLAISAITVGALWSPFTFVFHKLSERYSVRYSVQSHEDPEAAEVSTVISIVNTSDADQEINLTIDPQGAEFHDIRFWTDPNERPPYKSTCPNVGNVVNTLSLRSNR